MAEHMYNVHIHIRPMMPPMTPGIHGESWLTYLALRHARRVLSTLNHSEVRCLRVRNNVRVIQAQTAPHRTRDQNPWDPLLRDGCDVLLIKQQHVPGVMCCVDQDDGIQWSLLKNLIVAAVRRLEEALAQLV